MRRLMKYGFICAATATIAIITMQGCGRNVAEAEDSITTDTTAVKVEEMKADSAAMERARLDSIRARALKDDSLKARHIVVDKQSLMLYLRENGETLMEVPVCVGKGIGQKKRQGDHKTPEGTFKITSIAASSGWPHDFHDGRGPVRGAYGPWFMRLNTPQSTHIGIHGTDRPETTGTRDSDGCIRLRNEDLDSLRRQVEKGMTVIINPD